MPAPDMAQFQRGRGRHPYRDFQRKELVDAFKLDKDKAKLLCSMVDGTEDPLQLPEVAKWHAKLHNLPTYADACLEAALVMIEGHDVQGITLDGEVYPSAAYVNMGDSYVSTILLDLKKNSFMVTSYGDWIEANEKTSEE